MRVSLQNDEVDVLLSLLGDQSCEICQGVLLKLKAQKEKPTHPNKVKAVEKARRSRAKATKSKVESAINLLRLYGDEITYDNIAKEAGVSMASAKKYGSGIVACSGATPHTV